MSLLLLLLLAGRIETEVVVFVLPECPLARLYAERLNALAREYPQVCFRAVDCSPEPGSAEAVALAEQLVFPLVADRKLIARLGATRSPEIFVLTGGRVVYSGRIDDQYEPGANRAQPTRHDLAAALREVLAKRPVTVPRTSADGCLLDLSQQFAEKGSVTFTDVAPILHRRCGQCHRPGQSGPFPLLTYDDTVGWGPMMREVIEQGRMPPWHANPHYGQFANDRSLRPDERARLLAWIDAGSPPGPHEPPPPSYTNGWQIRPDLLLTMSEPFRVPPEGLLDYQEFVLDPHFHEDTWIQAVQLQPGNAAVVHHINAFVRPPGAAKETMYLNDRGDFYLAMSVPGNTVTAWPQGIAKVIPAGWQIVLSVHYQPIGSPEIDRSSIALELADPATVRQQVATRVLLDEEVVIPPGRERSFVQSWRLDEDLTLLALYPHMHLRGRSMRFEAISASGATEILLDVPRYDFRWQHRYVLAVPRQLPRGTTLRATAVFDNTADNPNNPAPTATVRAGRQATDAMFQACFEVVRTHENRLSQDGLGAWIPLLAALAAVLWIARLRFDGVNHSPCRRD